MRIAKIGDKKVKFDFGNSISTPRLFIFGTIQTLEVGQNLS